MRTQPDLSRKDADAPFWRLLIAPACSALLKFGLPERDAVCASSRGVCVKDGQFAFSALRRADRRVRRDVNYLVHTLSKLLALSVWEAKSGKVGTRRRARFPSARSGIVMAGKSLAYGGDVDRTHDLWCRPESCLHVAKDLMLS